MFENLVGGTPSIRRVRSGSKVTLRCRLECAVMTGACMHRESDLHANCSSFKCALPADWLAIVMQAQSNTGTARQILHWGHKQDLCVGTQMCSGPLTHGLRLALTFWRQLGIHEV